MQKIRLLWCLFCLVVAGTLLAGDGISLSDAYKQHSSLQWTWAIESLKHFPFNPSDKVLDIGCGDGKITALIASKVPNGTVVGLDISLQMLATATSNFSLPNLIFVQGSAGAIPFRGQFDKVVSFCALHWVIDQEKALQSIRESLKADGTALLVTPGITPCNFGSIATSVASKERWAGHFPNLPPQRVYYTYDEYAQLLEECGFHILSSGQTHYYENFSDMQAFIDWLNPLVNFADHLSQEMREEFVQDVAAAILLHAIQRQNGSIGVPQVKLEFFLNI